MGKLTEIKEGDKAEKEKEKGIETGDKRDVAITGAPRHRR